MTRLRFVWISSALVALAACATPPSSEPSRTATAAPAPRYGGFGFDVSGMDPTIAAGDDFFAHANGQWVARTPIPADRSSYNTFTMLREIADRQVVDLIREAAAGSSAPGSDTRKIGDFYASFMDEAAIEAKGVAPLQPELDRIAAIGDRKGLSRELGASLRADVDPLNATDLYTDRLFGLWVAEDLTDTSRYLPYILQGGLGMPDREYYLSEAQRFKDLRTRYQAHIAKVLNLAEIDFAEGRAARVLELETKIARAHWSGVDSSDIDKNKTRWRREDFARRAPGIDWPAYLDAAGLADQTEFGAWQADAITGIAKLVGSEPLQTWKDYLAFHAADRAAPFLPQAFVDENFAFASQALSGTPEQSPRWKRGVQFTNAALGEAIGKIYVERHFPPQTKAQAEAMVQNILVAFGRRIDGLAWMSPQTKARAREKLASFQVGVGYPATWRDYSGLQIVADDAYGNQARAELFEYRRNLAKLGKPVDRGEWFMTPQTVNALNAPLQNSISFPAAILQPPFFDPAADPAVNYGAIGGVIGHEIVHGFDDLGAMFDARGNLANWWTPQDMAHSKAASAQLDAQYDAYRPLPDAAVNGELTLGENIADLAGLAVSYDAWKLSLNGQPSPVIGGFTGDQRFFLGWAQNYRSKYRETALRRALLTDVHAPGEYRADTVRNIDAWYAAFDVQPGQKLYLAPDARVRIW